MAVVEQGQTVAGANPFDLGGQRGVIRRMEAIDACLNLICIGRLSGAPDGLIVEVDLGNQAGGVLARIKAPTAGVAVGVDYVAMKPRRHGGGAGQQVAIKPVHVPVGVGQGLADGVQPGANGLRHPGAGIGGPRG